MNIFAFPPTLFLPAASVAGPEAWFDADAAFAAGDDYFVDIPDPAAADGTFATLVRVSRFGQKVPLPLSSQVLQVSAGVFAGQHLNASDFRAAPASNPALSPPSRSSFLHRASLHREGFAMIHGVETGMSGGEIEELLDLLDRLPFGELTSRKGSDLYADMESKTQIERAKQTDAERERLGYLLERLELFSQSLCAKIKEIIPNERVIWHKLHLAWYAPRTAGGLHQDPPYAVASVALVGPGTMVAHEGQYEEAPIGIPLFLTGDLRQKVTGIPATWHRAPSNPAGTRRLVLLLELK